MDLLKPFLDKILGKKKHYDDAVDRLHYVWTVAITAIFSITIGAYQYGGNPIRCWLPAQFPGYWKQYVESYCFVENTYFVPMHEEIPDEEHLHERDEKEIIYYQWVPFVLALQALMFYLPHIAWRVLNWQSGINVKQIVTMTAETDLDKMDTNAETITKHLDHALTTSRDFGGKGNPLGWVVGCGKQSGSYVTNVYIYCKLWFLANVIAQFFILNSFLGPQYNWWGIGILMDMISGVQWHTSGHFPRVTLCDVFIRNLGNKHRWTLQCVIWVNMLNEKIFLFLWWWFFVIAIISSLNLLCWLYWALFPFSRRSFIRKYLVAKGHLQTPRDENDLLRFVRDRLRGDGVFMLHLISDNAGELLTTEVVTELWHRYRRNEIDYNEGNVPPPPSERMAST